jgi:hypothetical protein
MFARELTGRVSLSVKTHRGVEQFGQKSQLTAEPLHVRGSKVEGGVLFQYVSQRDF